MLKLYKSVENIRNYAKLRMGKIKAKTKTLEFKQYLSVAVVKHSKIFENSLPKKCYKAL